MSERITDAMRPAVQMLTIPNGFTLTIGSVLALAIGRDGYPGALAIWLFVVGGCAGFCVLAAVSRAHTARSEHAGPVSDLAVFNVVPVAVVPAVYAATHWIRAVDVEFALAGLLAVVLYVATFGAVAARTRRAQA